MSPVSKHIKRLRLQEGLTQEALAGKLFVSRQTISNWETGKSQPDLETLVQIAEALKTDATVLIYGPPDASVQKKARLRLLIPGGVLAVLGIGLHIWGPLARKLELAYYMIGPQVLIRLWPVPAFWLLLGWTLVQAADVFGLLKPPRIKQSRAIRISILALLLFYAISQLPFSIEQIGRMTQVIYYRQNKTLYPEGFGTVQVLPDWLLRMPLWSTFFETSKQPAVFLIPGILLRLFRPNKPT